MSSFLSNIGISKCIDYYSIKNYELTFKDDQDFIVGPEIDTELTIPNGVTLRVKNLVVLGKLTISSSDPENQALLGTLVTQDQLLAGKTTTDNVIFIGRHQCLWGGIPQFQQELKEIILDWFDYQKEWNNRIGLRSILCEAFLFDTCQDSPLNWFRHGSHPQ